MLTYSSSFWNGACHWFFLCVAKYGITSIHITCCLREPPKICGIKIWVCQKSSHGLKVYLAHFCPWEYERGYPPGRPRNGVQVFKNILRPPYSISWHPWEGYRFILPWAKVGQVTLQPMGWLLENSNFDATDCLWFPETAISTPTCEYLGLFFV